MRCTVCIDPRVQEIDSVLAVRSARSTAQEYGLGIESMKRHARMHLDRSARPEPPPAATPRPADPLAELGEALKTRALNGSDAASREYRLVLAAQAQQAATPAAYDVLRDESWVRLRALLLRALSDEPVARQKVIDAIREAESSRP